MDLDAADGEITVRGDLERTAVMGLPHKVFFRITASVRALILSFLPASPRIAAHGVRPAQFFAEVVVIFDGRFARDGAISAECAEPG